MGMDFSADHVIYRLAKKEDTPEIMNLRNVGSLDLMNKFEQ